MMTKNNRCPFNWYRTSGDINAGATSWLQNLQTTTKFQDYDKPLSVPGCWAYPDMLEVGRVAEPMPGSFFTWNRAHFGAWCIVSAPLILGLELSDEKLNPILDIIGNKEAVQVNQLWAGTCVRTLAQALMQTCARSCAPPHMQATPACSSRALFHHPRLTILAAPLCRLLRQATSISQAAPLSAAVMPTRPQAAQTSAPATQVVCPWFSSVLGSWVTDTRLTASA